MGIVKQIDIKKSNLLFLQRHDEYQKFWSNLLMWSNSVCYDFSYAHNNK